eukprot:gene320-177_t
MSGPAGAAPQDSAWGVPAPFDLGDIVLAEEVAGGDAALCLVAGLRGNALQLAVPPAANWDGGEVQLHAVPLRLDLRGRRPHRRWELHGISHVDQDASPAAQLRERWCAGEWWAAALAAANGVARPQTGSTAEVRARFESGWAQTEDEYSSVRGSGARPGHDQARHPGRHAERGPKAAQGAGTRPGAVSGHWEPDDARARGRMLNTRVEGEPGTGKTRLCRLLGRLLRRCGVLSRGHVVEVGVNELVGEHVGSE